MLNEDDSNVRIAKVDCTVDKQICSDQEVTGYPTLKFFKKGNTEGEKFRGTRDLPTLTSFINDQLRGVIIVIHYPIPHFICIFQGRRRV